MLKRQITYENPFTNEPVTETHYFHISKADLVQMEMEEHNATYEKDGEEFTGMRARLQRIVDSEDGKAIMAEIRDIIHRAYGKKDGERFVKSEKISDDFLSTEAYSQLIFELCTNPTASAEFMTGVVPGNLEQIAEDIKKQALESKFAEKLAENNNAEKPEAVSEADPEGVKDPTGLTNPVTPRVLTQQEIVDMEATELKAGLEDGRYKLS